MFLIASTLTGLTLAVPAQAKPTIPELESQITAASNKLEPIIEEYDRVHSQLTTTQAKADALANKLQPLQLQASVALSRLQPIVTQVYEGGPATSLRLLLASSPGSILDEFTMANAVADVKRHQINTVLTARDKYQAAKRELDATVATLAAQNADLAAKKNVIQQQINALQKLRQQAYGASGSVGTLRPVACPFVYTTGKGGIAARKACSAIGKPYVWAAAGPNTFDCSGLTLWAWAAAGVTLRHYTKWQWADNKPVSRANLQPGDLVFFYPPSLHHMAIYVGGGWVVHAPTTGDVVRMARMDSFPIAGYRRP